MFLSIQIDLIILKTYHKQFTLTVKNHCISSLSGALTQLDLPTYLGCLFAICQRLLDNSQIHQLADCQLADWMTRRLDILQISQLAD